MTINFEGLRPFAQTDAQREKIEECIKHGSVPKAAKENGWAKNSLYEIVNRIKLQAARRGYAPEYNINHKLPPNLKLTGTSTLLKDGKEVLQWVKAGQNNAEMLDYIEMAKASFNKEITAEKAVKFKSYVDDNLLNAYIITDLHYGMLAWNEEGGRNWDLKTAERIYHTAMGDLIARSPSAEIGYLCVLGDLLHYDQLEAVTTMSGNVLDADSRYGQMIDVAITSIRKSIDMLLRKHKKVIVLIAEGNHDLIGSQWLQAMFAVKYEDEKRIEIIKSAKPYYCVTHGKTMIASHHGHLKKAKALKETVPELFPEEWGKTKYRYCLSGHIHHSSKTENYGIISETFATLAARDAYASRHAFFSQSGANCITYHKEHGEIARITTRPIL